MTIPAECGAHEKPDGRWGCVACDESWDGKPVDCAKARTKRGKVDYSISVKKKANLYIERLVAQAPHLRSVINSDLNRTILRDVLCQLIHGLVGDCVPYEGEPSFNLLARDPQSPYLVDDWAFERALLAPEQTAKVANAFDRATAMREWKTSHPGLSLPPYERAPKAPAQDPARDAAAKELVIRVDRVMRAPADIWSVGDLLPVLTDCGAFISFFVPDAKNAGQLPALAQMDAEPAAAPAASMLPVDSRTADYILMLFRAFVLRNVTQWAMGAGDHHHPIWERVALECNDLAEPVNGPEYIFIQPMNRKSLGMLEVEAGEQSA